MILRDDLPAELRHQFVGQVLLVRAGVPLVVDGDDWISLAVLRQFVAAPIVD